VSDDADVPGSDAGLLPQKGDSGLRVIGEITARRRREVAGRPGDSSIVISKTGDAMPRQVVGDDEEWLVAE